MNKKNYWFEQSGTNHKYRQNLKYSFGVILNGSTQNINIKISKFNLKMLIFPYMYLKFSYRIKIDNESKQI